MLSFSLFHVKSIKAIGGMNIFHFNTNNPEYTPEEMYRVSQKKRNPNLTSYIEKKYRVYSLQLVGGLVPTCIGFLKLSLL